MARGLILSPQAACLASRFPLSLPESRNLILKYLYPARSFCCKASSLIQLQIDFTQYKESFSKQMTFAGLKPHHRIAIGVSGGPDSMALCVLTTAWKTEDNNAVPRTGGFIDGLLAIVVDHGLRPESRQEAHIVSRRLSEMGIRCEIASCSWSFGRPKLGHLQEEARNMRYQKLQDICLQHQTGVLLIAHHADDQAELFILRLSRNSGVLGLAGMAFASQIFSTTQLYDEGLTNKGILLVRPLLHLYKEDLYKVCQLAGQDWVEDPTNQSPLFARNRIRMSLGNSLSCTFKYELQALISTCRKTRSFVDQYCTNLINQAVTLIHQQGYAIIDLDVLNPSKVMDICLVKFSASVLQFIAQRHKPMRGHASKLLLDYLRSYPCKTSLTVAGCYLCPVPGSRGTKILVCCSVDSPLPSRMELTTLRSDGKLRQHVLTELEQIIAGGKAYSDHFVPDASDVYFLDSTSKSILTEAKKVNIITESTYRNILLLQRDEIKHFRTRTEDSSNYESKDEVESNISSSKDQLRPGQTCYFMNRFLITWKLRKHKNTNDVSEANNGKLGGQNWHHDSSWSCTIHHDMFAEVRHMNEHDWLYLAKLSKHSSLGDIHQQNGMGQTMEKSNLDYMKFSAKSTLEVLKSIPAAARRSLPVLVNQGQLLSVPSIGFKSCPCLTVSCEFKPRVPIGGGYSSFM